MKKLGFGLMRLPIMDGDYTKVDMEKFRDMADAFLAAGAPILIRHILTMAGTVSERSGRLW